MMSLSGKKTLVGKKALVTGAAGGIGRAIIAALHENGVHVAAADREPLTADREPLTADGTPLAPASDAAPLAVEAYLQGDLLNPAYADTLPAAAHGALGGLDIVINNAGVITRGAITEASDADWNLCLGVNVEAPFRICRAAIPLMAAGGGGVIVNIASCWGGIAPGPNHALYCMTKAALASLTQCMGMDHAHQGIRVNAVCPNEVDTPMLHSGFAARGLDPDEGRTELGKTVPLGRIAAPGDIADVVLFLISDASRYMAGALVEVNGGKPVG